MAKKVLAKKKGPRGKKGRAAAKLERQWGEEANEEEVERAKFRKGKRRLVNAPSRIKSNVKFENKTKKKRKFDDSTQIQSFQGNGNESSSSSSVSSDDSSIEDVNIVGEENRTLNSLLKKIKKRDGKSSRNQTAFPDEEMDTDDKSTDYSSDELRSDDDDEEEEIRPEEEIEPIYFDLSQMKPKGDNPYLSHFIRDPLPEEDEKELGGKGTAVKKIPQTFINQNLVVQASKEVRDKFDTSNNTLTTDFFSHTRKNLAQTWCNINARVVQQNVDASRAGEQRDQGLFSELQTTMYPMICNYCDVQINCLSRNNKDAIENLLVLHTLNHVLTANNDITMHNNRLRELEKMGEDLDAEEFRDQGYTRGKVLILLPTRSTAFEFVKAMLSMLGDNCDIEGEERFDSEFGPPNFVDNEDQDATRRRKAVQKAKGKDWLELFGDDVNSDDDFRVGISLSNKKRKEKRTSKNPQGVAVKFFSNFYHSDIIVASPLGLKISTTDEEEGGDGDVDFLTSVEVVLVHQADVLLMQNWDHVAGVMECLNQQPKKTTGIDFSRVRNYLLSGQAARWRQTIFVSRYSDPHLISVFNRNAQSLAGKMKIRRKVPTDEASICNVLTKVRQIFQRIGCDSIATQGECKVKYFTQTILPQLVRTKQKHTLIFIPSYFDFIAVRNIMLKHEIASHHFVSVTEYARVSEVSRGRARFLQGRKRIMLYTGRSHFFMRHHIKGVKHLIMFGLPENADFYPELLNMLSEKVTEDDEMIDIESSVSCLNLFTKYDAQCLERIVGSKHSERMVKKEEKKTFLFSS